MQSFLSDSPPPDMEMNAPEDGVWKNSTPNWAMPHMEERFSFLDATERLAFFMIFSLSGEMGGLLCHNTLGNLES